MESTIVPEQQDFSQGTVITVGVFDGVHKGHQQILSVLNNLSENKYKKLAVSFFPHPDELFGNPDNFKYIQTLEEREKTLLEYGCDAVAILEFNYELAGLSPETFIDYLIDNYNMKALVLGWDFALGKGRSGNYPVLKSICESKGIKIQQVSAVEYQNEVVSSSRIRTAILNGNLDDAVEMLGRDFYLSDYVITGHQRGGSLLNFPTANIKENPKIILPPNGVYAMTVELEDGSIHPAASFIGTRPTFEGTTKSIEMHLLDFCDNLYGRKIKVVIKKRIRDEVKFNSPDELRIQIAKDIESVRAALA